MIRLLAVWFMLAWTRPAGVRQYWVQVHAPGVVGTLRMYGDAHGLTSFAPKAGAARDTAWVALSQDGVVRRLRVLCFDGKRMTRSNEVQVVARTAMSSVTFTFPDSVKPSVVWERSR